MDLFAFIRHADPTKVRIGERQIEEGQVPLLESTEGRVIPFAGGNEQGDQNDNVEDVEPHDLNEEGGDAEVGDQIEESDCVVQDEGVNIVADEEFQATATDKPGGKKKRRRAAGASGSDYPPKKLREDHGTSGDVGASTAGKSLAALEGLLARSTLAVEVGVTAATTVPFVTSSVTLTLEREGGDAEVTSLVRSPVPPPLVMTATVATTDIASATSALVLGAGTEPAHHSLFTDSASPSVAGPDVAGPSHPAGAEVSTNTFYVSQDMDSKTLQ
ncbi:hypothetical protein Tco_0286217 [Tanacetum coccineum]